jgi:hypothetical protein
MQEKIKRKAEIRVYMIPPFKQSIQAYASEMGMSDSDFLIYCYNYWLEITSNPHKLKADVTKELVRIQNKKATD